MKRPVNSTTAGNGLLMLVLLCSALPGCAQDGNDDKGVVTWRREYSPEIERLVAELGSGSSTAEQ